MSDITFSSSWFIFDNIMKNKKAAPILFIVVTAILLAPLAYYFFLRSNSDALWRIVSQNCLASWSANHTPGACLKVDLDQSYVLFKDAKGPHHYLVLPTYPIAGLESPELEQQDSPDFMAIAWAERSQLSKEAGFQIPDDDVALAINSQWGRTQDQLHVHLACLQAAAQATITRLAPGISFKWAPLPEKIEGNHYMARRISHEKFSQTNPIGLLDDYIQEKNLTLGNFGLGMIQLRDGDFVLLATGFNLLELNLGSAEKIQDFTCALARQP